MMNNERKRNRDADDPEESEEEEVVDDGLRKKSYQGHLRCGHHLQNISRVARGVGTHRPVLPSPSTKVSQWPLG